MWPVWSIVLNENSHKTPDAVLQPSASNEFWLRPRHFRVFCVVLVLVLFVGLFVPTIEMFKGNISLGRKPLWMAYVGLLMPEWRSIAVPIVAAHLTLSPLIAWIVDRLVACTILQTK